MQIKRVADPDRRLVTVLFPLDASDAAFHISGDVTGSTGRVASFDEDISGVPAFTRFLSLPRGSYRLAILCKNHTTSAASRSSVDFQVD